MQLTVEASAAADALGVPDPNVGYEDRRLHNGVVTGWVNCCAEDGGNLGLCGKCVRLFVKRCFVVFQDL